MLTTEKNKINKNQLSNLKFKHGTLSWRALGGEQLEGYYVVDTVDHKVYFSEAGWNAFSNPASVDRWAVFRALMNIAGNSLGGVGAGTAGIIASFALIADWSIGLFQGENTK